MADAADDAELLAGLQCHDPRAFETFFETHVDRVYRIAAGILGDDADAQEVVQATFLSAFEAIDRFEPRARLGTWLYRIAYNHALMLVRRPAASYPYVNAPITVCPILYVSPVRCEAAS